MKKLILLLFLVLCVDAFGARIGSDKVVIGKKGSSADKILIMGDQDAGLKKTSEGLMFNHGDGNGYNKIGTGSGSGGSTAINNLDNAGFEEGIATNWSCTADKCSESSTDLNGNKSLQFDPTAQGNYFKSTLKSITPGLMGRSCEARVFYIGGDENLTAQVINGNATPIAEEVLKPHSIAGHESVGFICPTQAEIDADSDVGDLELKVVNATGTPAASSKFDDMHLGATNGLVETTLPDVFSANITNSGTVIASENAPFIDSVTVNGSGDYTVNFISGIFSVTPSVEAIVTNVGSSYNISISALSTSSARIHIFDGSNVSGNANISFTATKQGTDAKQQVQVYKSIPKVSENVNDFGAYISESGGTYSIGRQNTSFVQSLSKVGIGEVTVNFIPGVFAVAPTVTFGGTSGQVAYASSTDATTSAITIRIRDLNNNPVDDPFFIHVVKQGDDFQLPTIQPVIVGQVANSYAESASKNVRVESCQVNNSGTATIDTGSGLCESWIDSVNRASAGIVDITIKTGIFSREPVCEANIVAGSTDQSNCAASNASTTTSTASYCRNLETAANQDEHFVITCTGER